MPFYGNGYLVMESVMPRNNWRALLAPDIWPRLTILCLGLWLHAASSMLAATTLPSAVPDIGGAERIGWAFSLYLLGSIVAGASTGYVQRRAGLKHSMLLAACVYGLGCIVCASAATMDVFLGGRLFQGLGGGWLVALTYVAINGTFPAHLVPRLMAFTSGIWTSSALCGPLVGGSFATYSDWRFAYWAFAAQALLFIVIASIAFASDEKRAPSGAGTVSTSVPILRLVLVGAGIFGIAKAGASPELSTAPLLCLAALVLLALFLKLDANNPNTRMFPSKPFDPRTTLGAGLVFVFLAAVSTMSFIVYGPFVLESLYGITPLMAGYIVALEAVGWGGAAIICAGVRESSEARLMRCGAGVITLGIVGLTFSVPYGPVWLVAPWALAAGAGFGMLWGFMVRRIAEAAAAGERDVAASAIPTTQQIGFAIGAAAAGLVANSFGDLEALSREEIEKLAFWIFAVYIPVIMLANIAMWRLTRGPGRAFSSGS